MRFGLSFWLVALTLSVTGCTDGAGQDALPGAPEAAARTVTVTETATVTVTATAKETVTATETVTASDDSSAAEPSAAAPRPTPPSGTMDPPVAAGSGYDVEWAHLCADRIIEDIGRVDEYILDGIGVPTALRMLADSYQCLADEGVPPGIDAGDYLSRLTTLQDFTTQAADSFYDDPVETAATYSVVRQETAPVLQMLNEATGSDYTLP